MTLRLLNFDNEVREAEIKNSAIRNAEEIAKVLAVGFGGSVSGGSDSGDQYVDANTETW